MNICSLSFLLDMKIMSYSSFVCIVSLVEMGFFWLFVLGFDFFFFGNNRFSNYLRFLQTDQVLQAISTMEA